jgi:two-component system, OmpR family, sensor histidine kinase TctE
VKQSRLISGMTSILRLFATRDVPVEIESLSRAVKCYTQYQDQIATAQQRFIGNVAHQLKNPLTDVYMQIDMVAADISDTHQGRVERLRDSVHKMGRLIQQLLTLARCSPEALSSQLMKVIDLHLLIEENAGEWFDRTLAREIDLGFEIESAKVLGLSWLLREMLTNLIDNAVKYSWRGSRVTVRCGVRASGQPYCEVEDYGPGIPLSERGRVFERFYRSEKVQDTRADGTGLGLAIVKEVADCHGALISLDVPKGGIGTKVAIEFPAIEGQF